MGKVGLGKGAASDGLYLYEALAVVLYGCHGNTVQWMAGRHCAGG